MPDSSEKTKSFALSVLSNIGGSLVISTGVALLEHLRRQSIDWYGILALFLLTCAVFFFVLRILRIKPSITDKLKEIEARIPPPVTVNGILAGSPKQAPPQGEERATVDWREAFRNPQWKIVNDHVFENTSVDVDGKSFHRCSFKNVTLFFRGNAPVEFRETTKIDGTLVFATDNPAIHLYQSLQAQFASVPGAKLDAGAQDDKGREVVLPRLKVQPAEVTGITHPIPELRLKVVSMVSELQGFLGEHGPDPRKPDLKKEPGESDDDFLIRVRERSLDEAPRKWQAKLHGDYCLRFDGPIQRIRDEIRLRASIDDFHLNSYISAAEAGGDLKAIQGIVQTLWGIALRLNV